MKDGPQDLTALGWNDRLQSALDELDDGLSAGRVALEHRKGYRLWTERGAIEAEIPGKMRHDAALSSQLPAVGDWVAYRAVEGDDDKVLIVDLLPRTSKFSRKIAGESFDEQVVAANVDVVFLVSALNQDLNLRRIERYLTVAWESGAQPVILLTKTDLHEDVPAAMDQVAEIAPGVPVHALSNVTGEGLAELDPYVTQRQTLAVLGSSGVGKSSLINRLMDSESMKVSDIRWDGKGRHTTTHREMLALPSGAFIIDTPGMRELQLWDASEGIETTFSDIAELAASCRFSDCAHESEPGCAVKAALADGSLDEGRYDSYQKQLKEIAAIARKLDKKLAREESKKWKKISKDMRAHYKLKK